MAVCRVAESADGGVEQITTEDVEQAAKLVEYFKGMAKKAHGQIDSFDTSSKVAFELISLLREQGDIKATADELSKMLPSASDSPQATSKLIERISKEHDVIGFERGYRGKERILKISLAQETPVGSVGDVGSLISSHEVDAACAAENPELWELLTSLPDDYLLPFEERVKEFKERYGPSYPIHTPQQLVFNYVTSGYAKPKFRIKDGQYIFTGLVAA